MFSLESISRYVVSGLLIPSPRQASISDQTLNNCSCFVVTSDQKTSYFSNHRFWDFRNVQDVTTYMNSSDWAADWSISPWARNSSSASPINMVNDVANVYISNDNTSATNDTFLALQAYRLADLMSTAELETNQKNMYHASIRVFARLNPLATSSGACAGIFTYHDDSNESDIELLTKDTVNTWHLTNQPSVDDQGEAIAESTVVPTDAADWTQWHEMRIDWLPSMSRWFVDGNEIGNLTYSIPKKPSGLILNLWGDGGVWSGEMQVGGRAELQIQWVEMVFNTSGPIDGSGTSSHRRLGGRASAPKCQTACTIDNVATQGNPEIFQQSSSMSARLSGKPYNLAGWVALSVALVLYV